jgi:hypothetical protein
VIGRLHAWAAGSQRVSEPCRAGGLLKEGLGKKTALVRRVFCHSAARGSPLCTYSTIRERKKKSERCLMYVCTLMYVGSR